MYAVLKSFGLKGLNGFPVEVEADISGGMPALSIVGPAGLRRPGERRPRPQAALKNLGFKWPGPPHHHQPRSRRRPQDRPGV